MGEPGGPSCSGGLRPLVELCVEPAGLCVESITGNKARGGDGIQVELFQILKDDAVKVYLSKLWELNREDGQGSQSMRLQRVEYD